MKRTPASILSNFSISRKKTLETSLDLHIGTNRRHRSARESYLHRLAILAIGASSITTAMAQTPTWTGAVSNDITVAGNWSTGAAPTGAQDAVFSTSTPNFANVPSGNWDRRGTGVTTISENGRVDLVTGSARFISNGTFNVTGGLFDQVGEYWMIADSGLGTFNHSGGIVKSKVSRGWQLSNNSINQSGSIYNLSGTGALTVEHTATNGDGQLRHVWFGKGGDGGEGSAPIGTATGDIFNMTGGTATFFRTAGATNNSEVRISRNAGLLFSAGTASFTNFTQFRIGQGPSGGLNARVIVSGTAAVTIAGDTSVYVGNQDNGLLEVSGGSLNIASYLNLGNPAFPAGTGTVKVSGGTLTAGAIFRSNETSKLIYTGGDIYIREPFDNSSIIDEAWFDKTGAPRTVIATFDPNTNGGETHIRMAPPTGGFDTWIGQFTGLSDTTKKGDPDSDGISNLMEFVLNSNPGVPSTGGLPIANASDANNLVFSFTRRTDSVAGTTQTFQYGTNLMTWTDLTIPAASGGNVVIAPAGEGLETVTVTLPKSNAADGRLLVRLKVQDTVAP